MVRARGAQDFRLSHDPLADALFADRETESAAFTAALAAHRRRLDDEVGDEDDPRGRNVLVFHGRGGVGKTALSENLQNWISGSPLLFEHWGAPPVVPVAATVRLDLHGSHGNIDPAVELSRIRIALRAIKARWPLFDLAFAAYWASTHPGEALPLLEEEGDSEIAPTAIELLAALSEDMGAPSSLATVTVQALRGLLGRATSSLRSRLRIDVPPGYDALFERCTVEPTPDTPSPHLLEQLAALLTYELDQIDGDVPLVVVFIDTFERLTLDARRTGENALNRVAMAMSNVLFVVTGRNRLTWWETQGPELAFRGPGFWPLLTPGATDEPRQHALSHLSDKDRRLLISLLWERRGLPPVGADGTDVRDALADASGGLPEYIRLAVHAAAIEHAHGHPVTTATVTGSLDQLVQRLLEHTAEDEQKAIRAAALLHHADAELIAATAGVSVGAAKRATEGPLFTTRSVGDEIVPALHDEVRTAIRNASHRMSGGWADEDWDDAGTRALITLRERYTAARAAYRDAAVARADGAPPSARPLLQLTAHAIVVACETTPRIEPARIPANPDWLAEAMTNAPSYFGLRPYLPVAARSSVGGDMLTFLDAKSNDSSLDDRDRMLRELYHAGGRLRRIAARHLAYSLRDQGQWDEAIAIFDDLIAEAPDNALALRQRVITLTQARRLRSALAAVPQAVERSRPYLLASIRRVHGELDGFLAAADQRVGETRASDTRAVKDTIELEGIRIRYAALLGRTDSAEVEAVAELAAGAGHDTGRRDALLARLLVVGRAADVTADLRDLDLADRARNDGRIGFRTAMGRAALAFAADDHDELTRLHDEIANLPLSRGSLWVPVEMLLELTGHPLVEPPTEWAEPRASVVARWTGHWARWRDRVVAFPKTGGAG